MSTLRQGSDCARNGESGKGVAIPNTAKDHDETEEIGCGRKPEDSIMLGVEESNDTERWNEPLNSA